MPIKIIINKIRILIVVTVFIAADAGEFNLDILCDNLNAKSCFDLGEKYAYGENKNIDFAIKYFKKSCNLNYTKACFSLATIYDKGREHKKESVKYYTIACEKGNGKACNNLGNHYKKGEGVEQNITKALKLFQEACASDDGVEKGCTNLKKLQEFIQMKEQR